MSEQAAKIDHMFDFTDGASTHELGSRELTAFVERLAGLSTDVDDPERVERIGLLESIKSAAAAAQARMTASFARSQRAEQRAAGVPAVRVGQGIAAQVALARRESPARAARYTGWAGVLVEELPCTYAALERGETTEWRAMLVARETIWLSGADRTTVDAELADRLPGLGDRQVEVEAKRLAYRLDPQGFLARSRAAERDRRVSLRPAPDTMTRLSALLPVAQGVAAYAALAREADALRSAGDTRGRGQVMADTLVERVTGQATADGVPVEIVLVMTDRTLFYSPSHGQAEPDGADDAGGADRPDRAGGADEPAHLIGYGPIPPGLARHLARAGDDTLVWLRRLFTDPSTGQLAAMDTRRRVFDGPMRHAIIVRDQVCRTPWCGAPIRHADHALPVAEGGSTSLENGQGLCEACNYAKQAYGWTTEPGPGGTSRSVLTTTPTGHTYTSRAPDLPGLARTQPGPRQRAGPEPPPIADAA